MKSLQFRLGLWLSLSLALFLGIAALVMSAFPRYLTEEYVMTRIEHDADALKQRLQIRQDGLLSLSPGPLGPIYSMLNSGHYFQVRGTRNEIKSPSLGGFAFDFANMPVGEAVSKHGVGPDGQQVLLRSVGLLLQGEPVTLLVAEDISHLKDDIATARGVYLVAMLLTLLALLAVQRWIIRQSLRPLETARKELRGIATGEVEKIEVEVPREVEPLVDEVNRLTDTMRHSLSRSRKSLGNLAHVLKGPLAVISQVLDDPDSGVKPEVLRELRQQAEQIHQTIDHELRRARLSGAASPGEQFDVQREIEGLVNMLRKVYASKSLDFEVSIPDGLKYPLDRSDMLELFGNLLDNACKWAVSRVWVSVEQGERLCFRVEDDGPGMPESAYEELAKRGRRLDESQPGHGLGLSIVKDIVEDYSGHLVFSSSPQGGLRVEVCLS